MQALLVGKPMVGWALASGAVPHPQGTKSAVYDLTFLEHMACTRRAFIPH